MLTIALAAVLAAVGAGAVLTYVRQANNRALSGLKTETVLEAKAGIPAGTSLLNAQKQGWLEKVQIPQGTLSAVPVRSVNSGNQNLVVSAAVASGQLLLAQMLGTTTSYVANGGISIPPGLEAVTIQVCLSQAVAGYVTASSYVSVFDTYPVSTPKSKGSLNVQETCDVSHQIQASGTIATRIVLPHALVLSVGQSLASQGTSAGIGVAASSSAANSNGAVLVTLAVNQNDAERLINIDEVGLPYMSLLTNVSKWGYDSNTLTPLFRTH